MSLPFEGIEPWSAPATMTRFAQQAELSPQTPSAEAFRVFSAAGMIATLEIERNAADIDETAVTFFHGMANMYQILFDDYDGFAPRDDQIEEIIDAASDLRAALETEMGFDQPTTSLVDTVDVSGVLYDRYLATLRPGIDPYSLNTWLSAYIDAAADRIEAVTDGHAEHLESISNDFMGAAANLLGMDTSNQEAAEIRQQAITVADAFLRGDKT